MMDLGLTPEQEALVASQFDLAELGDAIHRVATWRHRSASDDGDARHVAKAAVHASFDLLWQMLGDDLMRSAFGPEPAPDASRREQLEILAERIDILGQLLLVCDYSPIAFEAVYEELEALIAGDEPRLFARIEEGGGKGRPTRGFRLARHKLNALRWVEYLKANHGLKAYEAKTAVAGPFGVSPDALDDWEKQVRDRLPANEVDFHLRVGRIGHTAGAKPLTESGWHKAIEQSAKAFKQERDKREK